MAKIKFERVERVCGWNQEQRAKQAAGTLEGRIDLLYDFNVIIDGEHRAIWSRRAAMMRGYTLQDANHAPIDGYGYQGRKVESQDRFEPVISELLDADKIPTMAELAMLKIIAEAEEEAKTFDAHASAVRYAKEKAAPAMFKALADLLVAIEDGPAGVAGKDSGGNIVLKGSFLAFAERARNSMPVLPEVSDVR